jgi:hypothetical protein
LGHSGNSAVVRGVLHLPKEYLSRDLATSVSANGLMARLAFNGTGNPFGGGYGANKDDWRRACRRGSYWTSVISYYR